MELEKKVNQQILQQRTNTASPRESDKDKKNYLAIDVSSKAQQSDPKRQDSKATPTKNHPVPDVESNQNP